MEQKCIARISDNFRKNKCCNGGKEKVQDQVGTRQHRGPLFHQLVRKLGSWLACELLNDLIIRHNSFPLRKAALLTSLPSRIDDEFWQDRLDVSLSHFATYGSASHGRINIGAATIKSTKDVRSSANFILNLLSQAKTLLEE